jgi:hypothetical protein
MKLGFHQLWVIVLCSWCHAAESVVVYRSQFERDRDLWLYENPEVMLWIFGALSLTLLSWVAVKIIWPWLRRR